MSNDQLLTIILSIGLPILTGFGFVFFKLFSFQKDVSRVMKDLSYDIKGISLRISHIEGYLKGRDVKTGTQEK